MKNKWILFSYSIPATNAKARMRTWRRISATGAAQLKTGLQILPNREDLMENITWFFGQVLFVGGSGGLLVQSTLAGLGIEVELAQLAAIEIPVCIIATVVAIVFYVIKDRKMIQKYYK